MATSQYILQIPCFKCSKYNFLWYKQRSLAACRFSTDIQFEPEMGSDSALCSMLTLVEWVELLQLITAQLRTE